jgi:hypothetical protein
MLKQWLKHLWENEDGFFGIGMGPSSQEKQQFGDISSLANFSTAEGEGDINASDSFYKAILSGDPSKISRVLGPAISATNKQGQEQKKTLAEFGNRGGGTNAGAQQIDTNTRTSIDSLIAQLTGNAASALGASGSSLLSAGVSAHEGAFNEANTIHQQQSAQLNDLFKSIASVAAAPFTGGKSLTSFTGGSPGAFSLPSFGGGDTSSTPVSGSGDYTNYS